MRFWTVATVLLVVGLVITDVSARKSNRDRKTAKTGKQKQNDFHASRQKEERVDEVLKREKKAKQILHSKERKRRSIEDKEPTYERKEHLAVTKDTEPPVDKEQSSGKSEVKQVDHQLRNRKTETHEKFVKVEKLRKSKTIVEDALGGTEDYLPNGQKPVGKRNLEKPSKTDKPDTRPEVQVVRSSLKKDKGKSEKSKVTKKDETTEVEEEAIEAVKTVVERMKDKEMEESSCVDGDFTCNDEVEVKNSKKSTCNENVMQERVQKEDVEEFENCTKSLKSKRDKYTEKKQKERCKS
ncbi:DNA ligase 1 isoform X2 [Cephus cinctus]|uniref:DNA ligase 1 isoform X2 n=1 Tax=Cephus cinctus TaxID=211228 RepID=A0AAJ7FFT2_CEPCN|nr:DNA ligase 1 isoform X2 [Cephus cinctus]